MKVIVEALKSKGFSSIGAAGFCWGGEFSFNKIRMWLNLLLISISIWFIGSGIKLINNAAKPVVDLAKIKSIDAAVLLHASFVTVEDIKGLAYNSQNIVRDLII